MTPSPPAVAPRQYLTFRLGAETFALEITKVREVLEFAGATKVPQAPPFMRGIINLRGSVVPVFDTRHKLGMEPTERTINTCVVIVETRHADELVVFGALADSVQEVLEMEPSQIEAPPRMGVGIESDFIQGMGKQEEGFVILLDIDRVFAPGAIAGTLVEADASTHTA